MAKCATYLSELKWLGVSGVFTLLIHISQTVFQHTHKMVGGNVPCRIFFATFHSLERPTVQQIEYERYLLIFQISPQNERQCKNIFGIYIII